MLPLWRQRLISRLFSTRHARAWRVFDALSDPVRVAIYADIVSQECSQNCSTFLTVSDKTIPKSTLSQHFRELREAGLIRGERRGSRSLERGQSLRLSRPDPAGETYEAGQSCVGGGSSAGGSSAGGSSAGGSSVGPSEGSSSGTISSGATSAAGSCRQVRLGDLLLNICRIACR